MKKFPFSEVYTWVFIIVFFAMLFVPLKNLNFNPNQINDDFYGRSRLISLTTSFRLMIGDRVFPKSVVGEAGWLFLTAEKSSDIYQNVIPFSDDELAQIQASLDLVTEKYAQEGITLIVVVPPAKQSIYPEFMPDEITVLGDKSRLDQLVAYLSGHGNSQILDLRPALLEAKDAQQVYYSTDTHWNLLGAFTAYQQVIGELGQTYPQLVPYSLSDYEISTSKTEVLDIAQNIGSKNWREEKIEFTPKTERSATFREFLLGQRKILFSATQNEALPSAVVYYDSFFFTVNPFLAEHFEQAFYIQNYTGGGLWTLDWVDDMKPDIVIVEFSERYIQDLPRLLRFE